MPRGSRARSRERSAKRADKGGAAAKVLVVDAQVVSVWGLFSVLRLRCNISLKYGCKELCRNRCCGEADQILHHDADQFWSLLCGDCAC
eukprot:scaffold227064_cov18-Tisochrysis_lutea.AAC.1